MKITARQLNYLITIIYNILVHHYHGYVSILSERITSEDQRYWSYYKEVYAVLYDHGVALVIYGIVILTECEVFSKSLVDHHCVWRWDPILRCWRRYTYISIYTSWYPMPQDVRSRYTCLSILWVAHSGNFFFLNICVPVMSHHWKGSFISHVGVEVPVTDVDMVAPRRDAVVDDEHWT